MAHLPVDPMFGKVLLASAEMGCAEEALAVVAMVSSDMVFVTPREKREEAADARKRFIRWGDGGAGRTWLRSAPVGGWGVRAPHRVCSAVGGAWGGGGGGRG